MNNMKQSAIIIAGLNTIATLTISCKSTSGPKTEKQHA
jgi:hypothetical protein